MTLLVRGSVAEAAAEGRVAAERYIEPVELQAGGPSAFIHLAPDAGAERLGQLLFGERFEVLEEERAFAFGRSVRDGCVGWIARAALAAPTRPTHRVQTLRAFAYAEPDVRAAPAGPLPLNALVSAHTGRGRWLHDPAIGWLAESDLAPTGARFEEDVAAVALRFVDAPYLKGARDGLGLDEAGLVQQALYACGLACPRVLDGAKIPGRHLPPGELPERGDLAIWSGGAAVVIDPGRVVCADALGGVQVRSLPTGDGRGDVTFTRPLAFHRAD